MFGPQRLEGSWELLDSQAQIRIQTKRVQLPQNRGIRPQILHLQRVLVAYTIMFGYLDSLVGVMHLVGVMLITPLQPTGYAWMLRGLIKRANYIGLWGLFLRRFRDTKWQENAGSIPTALPSKARP